jgi:hypothetical protein
MTMSTPNNPLPAVPLGQIVQDLQNCQQDIAAHCADSTQQLQASMQQLQALATFINTTMSVLQSAYDGLAVLQSNVAGGVVSPPVTASPPVIAAPAAAAVAAAEPAAPAGLASAAVGDGDPIGDSGQNIVESIKNISALLTASAQKPAEQ